MKLIIAGSRDGTLSGNDWTRLDQLKAHLPVTEVVSGAQRGIDTQGESWGRSRGLPVKRFPAEWKKYGPRAGPLRNAQMAAYADAVVLFPGGKGTASMASEAAKAGIRIIDWRKG